MKEFVQECLHTRIEQACDVLVCGGVAGIAAALAAVRPRVRGAL